MRRVLATEHGKALYRQRPHIIESVFGTPNTIAASPAFTAAAVRTEWRLCMATHNLLKLHSHHLVSRALPSPPRSTASRQTYATAPPEEDFGASPVLADRRCCQGLTPSGRPGSRSYFGQRDRRG